MQNQALSVLEWYIEAGVEECCANFPTNFLENSSSEANITKTPPTLSIASPENAVSVSTPTPATAAQAPTKSYATAIAKARELADSVTTLEDLRKAVEQFDGCELKASAKQCVFADGNPDSRVMLIGEAPGAEEERQGIPFCGEGGQLLDAMLFHVGLTRENFYITNTVFWRPPGNRNPTAEEREICLPFVEKHIALVEPAALVLIGGIATQSLLNEDKGITRLRGKEFTYSNDYLRTTIPVHVMYHPSYLLRQPAQKKIAWQDSLQLRIALENKGLPADYFV